MSTTYVRIDTEALKRNIEIIREGLAPGVRYLSVVKANGYGHGMEGIALAAVQAGADWLAVAIPEEGVRLREAGITVPILVLGGLLPASLAAPVAHRLSVTVFRPEILKALAEEAARQGQEVHVHIKVDTGMNRLGVKTEAELMELLALAKSCPGVHVEGLFTHFAESESADPSFTLAQAEKFDAFVRLARDMGFSPLLHAANSGAIHANARYHYDLVRGGLAQYGYPSGPGCGEGRGLVPIMSWRTAIVHLKDIAPGDTVSYGRLFRAERPMRIATLPVGYGDGYRRCFSGKASVLLHGQRAPVLGAVCMDQCLVDVSEIPGVALGDEAVLLGAQGEERIDAVEMAAWADTIPYEILCGVADRVRRVFE